MYSMLSCRQPSDSCLCMCCSCLELYPICRRTEKQKCAYYYYFYCEKLLINVCSYLMYISRTVVFFQYEATNATSQISIHQPSSRDLHSRLNSVSALAHFSHQQYQQEMHCGRTSPTHYVPASKINSVIMVVHHVYINTEGL